MYGVDYQNVSYKEFFAEMDNIMKDKQKQTEAKEIQNKLIRNALKINMDKEKILNDVNFHLTVKSMMKKYYCNAFTIRCFELCGSHIAAERQITPCLNNIILRDEGYPSSCEGDINALFTTMTFMYLAKRTGYPFIMMLQHSK
jgi:L-fucose isomerase-like protein